MLTLYSFENSHDFTSLFFENGTDVECVQGLSLWRNSSSAINGDLYKGYRQGNTARETNEFLTGYLVYIFFLFSFFVLLLGSVANLHLPFAAYDFLDTSENGFNVNIWYNSTYKNDTGYVSIALLRVPRSLNAVSAFISSKTTEFPLHQTTEITNSYDELNLFE